MQRNSVFRGGVGMKSRTTQAKELRRSGMSYQAIADRLGVSYGAVYGWLNGLRRERTPNPLVDLECVDCGRAIQRRQVVAHEDHRCVTCANRADKAKGRTMQCIECGTEFWAKPSEVARGRKYCSRVCWRKAPPKRSPEATERMRTIMRKRTGQANPGFKHGRRTGQQIRGFSLEAKGEGGCRYCGRSAEHAHHAVPRSLAPAARRDLRNCLPLCAACHIRWHRGEPIPRSVFTADEWAFVETLIGPTWLDKRYPSERPKRVEIFEGVL